METRKKKKQKQKKYTFFINRKFIIFYNFQTDFKNKITKPILFIIFLELFLKLIYVFKNGKLKHIQNIYKVTLNFKAMD